MGLFSEVFSTSNINLEAAEAIEESLHQLYINDEDNGIYWVGACQCLRDIRVRAELPYNGIFGLKRNQIVYVRYDADEPLVEIQVLGLDDEEVYSVDKKLWNDKLVDSFVLLPNNKIYASETEAKVGLAVRRVK